MRHPGNDQAEECAKDNDLSGRNDYRGCKHGEPDAHDPVQGRVLGMEEPEKPPQQSPSHNHGNCHLKNAEGQRLSTAENGPQSKGWQYRQIAQRQDSDRGDPPTLP